MSALTEYIRENFPDDETTDPKLFLLCDDHEHLEAEHKRLRGISREAQRLEEDNDALREEVHDFKAKLVHVTVERDKLREELAVAHETIDAFQTASGLCVPAEEQGGDPGGVQPRHVEEHVHALAKRVEELTALLVAYDRASRSSSCDANDARRAVWVEASRLRMAEEARS